jgi:two-component system, OmpR family, phosphate regulon sensor histidine kinase PhoR
MSSSKNLSAQQIAVIIGFIIAVVSAITVLLLSEGWLTGLVVFLLIFLFSYLLVNFFLQRFISRRIKLIYKFIYQTKASRKQEIYYKYILPRKTIDEVELDVEKWAYQKSNEVEVLRQNEAYRKEFLQNLAHEFKTPLFAIQGYVDTLLGGAMENPEVRKKFLDSASKNVERLVNLMNDLDEIAKLERGEQSLHKETFIIQDLIYEVFDTLSLDCNEKKIRSYIKKGCESPVTVVADKEKIRQVMINLVSNSCKYGKSDGSIVASVYRTDDSRILVEISDDGTGIEPEHLNRIFERFYRTDSGRSRDKGGTGLGLAICKHIVEAHGQTIHVRSTPDVGTTIGFTLESAS